jgi:hypothetical protein
MPGLFEKVSPRQIKSRPGHLIGRGAFILADRAFKTVRYSRPLDFLAKAFILIER